MIATGALLEEHNTPFLRLVSGDQDTPELLRGLQAEGSVWNDPMGAPVWKHGHTRV